MKKRFLALAAGLAAAFAGTRAAADEASEFYRETIDALSADIASAIASSPVPKDKAVALLPVRDPSGTGWLPGLVRNALTKSGRTCVIEDGDPAFKAILDEIEWDERKGDILDPATIDKFGSLKSAQILLSAEIAAQSIGTVASSGEPVSCWIEVELHAVEIATRAQIWGDTVSKRLYAPDSGMRDVDASAIPAEIRALLREKFREAVKSSMEKSAKLRSVNSIAIIPVAGDKAGYALSSVRDAVAATRWKAVNLDAPTLREARRAAADRQTGADAILYASLRDLSAVVDKESPVSEAREFRVEIQLAVENAATREILWSDTVSVSESNEKGGAWYSLVRYFPVLKEKPYLAVLIPLLAIVALLALRAFIKAGTRVR